MKRSFADEIASSRQDRVDAKQHLNDAQRKYEMNQSKYEMHLFAADVYRQYITKKMQENDEIVSIDVNAIDGIRGIREENFSRRGNRKRARENQKEHEVRSGDLSPTEKAIFLNTLNTYFGLKVVTMSGGRPSSPPSLHTKFMAFHVTENKLEMNQDQDQEEQKADHSPSSSDDDSLI